MRAGNLMQSIEAGTRPHSLRRVCEKIERTLEEWIPERHSRAGGNPVIVVASHKDQ
jgi:hypothetical protein